MLQQLENIAQPQSRNHSTHSLPQVLFGLGPVKSRNHLRNRTPKVHPVDANGVLDELEMIHTFSALSTTENGADLQAYSSINFERPPALFAFSMSASIGWKAAEQASRCVENRGEVSAFSRISDVFNDAPVLGVPILCAY